VAISLLAVPNIFRTINPFHGSIVRKRSGGKRQAEMVVSSFSVRKAISGEENTGYLLVSAVFFFYRFVKCSNHGVIRTFEKAANEKKPSVEQFPP
jgi:hypothetical protein